jgi:transcriptional regulator with XRE-family HTH domain
MIDVGTRIRAQRKSQGLTQLQLCTQVGISESFLSEVETGKRNLSSSNLLDLAKALGCSCDFLLTGCTGGEDIPIPPSLKQFGARKNLPRHQLSALAGVYFHLQAFKSSGQLPHSVDWAKLYSLLREYTEA